MNIDINGTVTGTGNSNSDGRFDFGGSVMTSGTTSAVGSGSVSGGSSTWSGGINIPTGVISGTWSGGGGYSGTFTGSKI